MTDPETITDALILLLAAGKTDEADHLLETLNSVSESVGLVDKLVTVHRGGKTFQQHRKVSAGDEPAESGHDEHAADAHAITGGTASPETHAKVKGLLKSASDRVNQFIADNAGHWARLTRVASLIESVLTTPEDVAKNPALMGKWSSNAQATGDAAADAAGVPGAVVSRVAAYAIVKGWAKVKRTLGLSESEITDEDLRLAAEALAGLVSAATGGDGPDADAILEYLRTVQQGGE